MGNRLLIIGSGGHAGQVIDAVELSKKYKIVGLSDDYLPSGTVRHRNIVVCTISDIKHMADTFDYLFVAIGDNQFRKNTMDFLSEFTFATIVHPKAYIAKTAYINDGAYIGVNAVVANECIVGYGAIINTNSSLDHDSMLGNYSSLNPNTATGGNVIIDELTMIGMGSNIKNGISIGSCCSIGMGSVIAHNVPNNTKIRGCTYY